MYRILCVETGEYLYRLSDHRNHSLFSKEEWGISESYVVYEEEDKENLKRIMPGKWIRINSKRINIDEFPYLFEIVEVFDV